MFFKTRFAERHKQAEHKSIRPGDLAVLEQSNSDVDELQVAYTISFGAIIGPPDVFDEADLILGSLVGTIRVVR